MKKQEKFIILENFMIELAKKMNLLDSKTKK